MDILVVLGIVVAILLMAVGLFMMLRRPDAAKPVAQVPDPEAKAALTDELSSESTSAVPSEPVISANQFIIQTIHQQLAEHPVEPVAVPTAVEPEPVVVTERAPALEIEPSAVAQDFADLPVLDQEVATSLDQLPVEPGGLDAMLDDLEQATLESTDRIQPTLDAGTAVPQLTAIETAQLAEWEGDSLLIDEHLADHSRSEEDSILVQAEHIIAISMIPKSGRPLEGRKVLEALRKHGLRFGEMSLFHRYEESSGQGALMFSVLKFTKDGPVGFDLDTMMQESFEGLSFFLALPGIRPLQGFDMMISTAQRLSIDFYAQLFDEEMNLFSEQLKSHYRH